MSKRLYDCTTNLERLDWIKARLLADHIVTENTLLLGGVTNPYGVINGLRATGMHIEQIAVDYVDGKGVQHKGCTAWRFLRLKIPR